MERCSGSLDNDNKLEDELFDLKIFINNFVFRNWRYIDYKVKTEDIILELEIEDEEYFNDDEIY